MKIHRQNLIVALKLFETKKNTKKRLWRRRMNSLIKKLVRGVNPTEKEIQEMLYEICDSVHASCDVTCPVYEINHGPVNPESNCGCACFKDGKAMYDFIRRS
jgi:hypothetical protein